MRVQKAEGFKALPGYRLYLRECITSIAIHFDKVIKTLAKSFKNQAHMLAFLIRVNEILFKVNYSILGSTFIHDVTEYIYLNLCTLVVSLDRSNDFHRVIFVFSDVQTFKCAAECTVSKK